MTAPFSLIYVPNKLIVRTDAVATAKNILANETLFRLDIVNELMGTVFFMLLLFALYRLLSGVDEAQARLMVIFGLVSVPITFAGAACNLVALRALQTPDLAMALIRLHGSGIVVNEIFWGLWLFPFGVLIIRSGFIPKILGVLLIVNGFAYVISSVTSMLLPAYAGSVSSWMMIPETGELWIMLWLIVKGISVRPVQFAQPAGVAA